MKLSVHTYEQIIPACILLPMLTKNRLCMESYQYMSSNNNKNSICNASQPINLPWKVHFELVNRTTNTVFFKMQRTRTQFPHNFNRWSGRIKSQIYKDINIFKNTIYKLIIKKKKSSYTACFSSFFLSLHSLIFNLFV